MTQRSRPSKRSEGLITSANEEYPHIGRRVRVECSDGNKYDGLVSLWDAKVSEYKIVFDDGK